MISILLGAVLSLVSLAVPSPPQDIPVPVFAAPTKDAAAPTPAEMVTLKEGYALFQQKKFDEAIAKYQDVLTANPNSAVALHEIALAHLQKKDYAKAIDYAMQSNAFKSAELGNSLAFVGSAFDMMGEPKKAVEAYERAITLAPSSGTLYYNKAVTEMSSLNDVPRGVATLKRGAVADPRHPTTQQSLARYFMSGDMRTPAFFALSRLLIIEPSGQRTRDAFGAWYNLLNSNVKVGPDGKAEVGVNPNKKKEEGDLTQLDLFFALSQIEAGAAPQGTPVGERLVAQVTKLLGVWTSADPKSDSNAFLFTYYMPYFRELHEKTYDAAFVYYSAQSVGLPGAREWLAAHPDDVQRFVTWDKAYVWPALK